MTFLSLLLTAAVLLGLTDAQMGWNLDDCPTMELDSSSNLKGCAYKTFPLDRENDPTGVTVNSFTRMFYTGDAPTDDTLVLIEGGPGFSNHAFIPIADFLLSLNPAWTIYLQDHRGTGLSSPVNCAANPSVCVCVRLCAFGNSYAFSSTNSLFYIYIFYYVFCAVLFQSLQYH